MTDLSRILAILLGVLVASIADAQQIDVRSGAHDGFSRLVIRIPDGRPWNIVDTSNGVRLDIDGHQDGFDTSGVFDLIDRRHIDRVSGTPGSLDIAFSCACSASSFVAQGRFVAIDVAPDTSPTATQAPSALLANTLWPSGTRQLRLPIDGPAVNSAAPAENRPVTPAPRSVVQPRAPRPIVPEVIGSLNSLPSPEGKPDAATADRLAETQKKLAQRVAVAATQGILAPTQNRIDLPTDSARPQIDTRIFDSSDALVEEADNREPPTSLNLRITSSSDLPTESLPVSADTTSMGVRCIAPETVGVGEWGAEQPPSKRIAALRSALFTEFDRIDEGTAIELAKLYLHYGFGAEARQVLSIEPRLARQNPALIEIADIMEYGAARESAYLHHFADCGSDVALWGLLAQTELDQSMPINADAALRALTGLPMHLRRFVAPKLSRLLLGYGDEARAEIALRSVERAPATKTAATHLARAELQLEKGETETAQQTLAEVVSSNDQQSAEALIKFVDSHLEEDTLIDQSVATLVAAYAIELRGDPLGAELRRTQVLALAKSGQFYAAFDALDRMRTPDNAEIERSLNTLLMDIVTRSASDVEFLERVFAHIRRGQPLDNVQVSLAAARRALDLGFAQHADIILERAGTLPVTNRTKELRAEIALDLGRPREAEAQLFNVKTEAADRMRARAKAMDDNHRDAAGYFDRLGLREDSMRAAWLASDWDRLSETGATPFAQVADIVETPMEESQEVDGMLGRLSDAVSESRQARAIIEDLLGSTGAESASEEP